MTAPLTHLRDEFGFLDRDITASFSLGRLYPVPDFHARRAELAEFSPRAGLIYQPWPNASGPSTG